MQSPRVCTILKVLNRNAKLPSRKAENTLSSLKPGLRALAPHGLACTAHYSSPAFQFEHRGTLPSAGEGQSWLVLAPPFPQVLKPFLTPRSRHWHAFGGRQPHSPLPLPCQGSGYFVKPTRAPSLEEKRLGSTLCPPGSLTRHPLPL